MYHCHSVVTLLSLRQPSPVPSRIGPITWFPDMSLSGPSTDFSGLYTNISCLEPNKSSKHHLTSWDSKTTSSQFLNTIKLALRGISIHTIGLQVTYSKSRSFHRNCQTFQPPNFHSVPVQLITSVKDFTFRNIKFSLYSHPWLQPIKFLGLLILSSSTFILHGCMGQNFCAFIQNINESFQGIEPRVQP